MAQTGFYSSMQQPGVATPILESFSMADRAQVPPQRPPMQHGQMSGGGRGGWQGMPGMPPPHMPPPQMRGGFQGGMPGGMQGMPGMQGGMGMPGMGMPGMQGGMQTGMQSGMQTGMQTGMQGGMPGVQGGGPHRGANVFCLLLARSCDAP